MVSEMIIMSVTISTESVEQRLTSVQEFSPEARWCNLQSVAAHTVPYASTAIARIGGGRLPSITIRSSSSDESTRLRESTLPSSVPMSSRFSSASRAMLRPWMPESMSMILFWAWSSRCSMSSSRST